MVCLPKKEGGLGVLNLRTQNEAVLLKYLHKFYTKADIPWVHLIWEKYYQNGRLPNHTIKGSFWWRSVLRLLDNYKGMAVVSVSNGSTCNLWSNLWEGMIPQFEFPELYSFAKQKNISVQKAKSMTNVEQLFHLPFSAQAFQQLQTLVAALEQNANSEDLDSWSYIWASGLFTSSKAYKHLTGTALVHPGFTWLWRCSVQHKHKTFFWLLMKDRLSTRNLLKRRNMELPSYDCVLYTASNEESLHHLFLQCPFAQQCWQLINLDISDPFDIFA